MASLRLARLRPFIKDDLEKLPDLPGVQPELETDPPPVLPVIAQHSPARSPPNVQSHVVDTEPRQQATANAPRGSDTPFSSPEDSTQEEITQMPVQRSSRPLLGLQHGQLGPLQDSYCPMLELSKYCYKYVRVGESQRVATRFFDAGKFWARGWDLFSVCHTETHAPIGLVTETQLQDLLNEINTTFQNLDLKINGWLREHGLVTKFPLHPDTRPRYLGRCWSKDEYTAMMQNAPGYGFRLPSEDKLPDPDDKTLEAFKAQMDKIEQLRKSKNITSKADKIARTVTHNGAMAQQLKRTQRYLGLRPKNNEGAFSDPDPKPKLKVLSPIDVTVPAPYAFDSAPIIICVDIESYERDSSKITEVGICTLDTLDLQGVAPGVNGENWRNFTRDRHLRISEYTMYRNRDFVDGCPGNFEFGAPKGESEFVSLRDMPEVLRSAFSPPYSKELDVTSANAFPGLGLLPPSSRPQCPSTMKRNILILGHDPNGDISNLNALGFNPLAPAPTSASSPNVIEVLDTAVLYRTYARLEQSRRLGAILAEFDINAWFLHNAGNDAVYTMWAMFAIAVNDAAERGDAEKKKAREARVEARIQEELQEQEQLKRAAVAAYDGHEEDDGGESVRFRDPGYGALSGTSGTRLTSDGKRNKQGNLPSRPHSDAARARDRGRGRACHRAYATSVGTGRGYQDRDAP